jgi:ribosomal protein S18 acetylase RimI-like enzyme
MYTNNNLFNPYRDFVDMESLEKKIQQEAKNSRYFATCRGTSLYGKFLEFDTRIFKKRSVRIKGFSLSDKRHLTDLSRCLEKFLGLLKKDKIKFISCKIHHDDVDVVGIFEDAGFHMIGCQQQYRFDFAQQEIPQLKDRCRIRMGNRADAPEVAKLSRECFKGHFDRFHNDSFLRDSYCDDLHEEWGRNSFVGFAAAVIIAQVDKQMVGFATLKENGELNSYSSKKIGDLVLLGVDPGYRKSGVHTTMVRHGLLYWQKKAALAEIVTEAGNIPALRTYATCGFKPSSSFLVLHKHL